MSDEHEGYVCYFVWRARPDAATSLTFQVPDVEEGEYVLRLRVDGVDSIPVDFSGDLPQFDEAQKVIIEP